MSLLIRSRTGNHREDYEATPNTSVDQTQSEMGALETAVEEGSHPIMSGEEQKAMVAEINEFEDFIKAWRETSGMHTILKELHENKDKKIDSNDLTLSMATGIEEGMKEAVTGVLESAVIAALLISFSIPLVVDPPDGIGELENDDWRKILHLFGWGCMSVFGVANIIYARVYTAATSRAVRSVDKLRINLAGNAFTEGLLMVYSMFFFLTLGILADTLVFYGTTLGIIFTTIAGLSVLYAVKVSYKYISAGHIEYGWRANRVTRDDPVYDMMLFETLKKRINYAKRLHDVGKPFFRYSDKEKETVALGISEDGQKLIFKDD